MNDIAYKYSEGNPSDPFSIAVDLLLNITCSLKALKLR